MRNANVLLSEKQKIKFHYYAYELKRNLHTVRYYLGLSQYHTKVFDAVIFSLIDILDSTS